MRAYATLEDFAAEVGLAVTDDTVTDPETGTKLTQRGVRAASRAVDGYLVSAVYRTDTDGLPLDADLLTLFKDAALEQMLAMWEAGKTLSRATASNPLGRPLQSASIGSASYTADTTQSSVEAGLDLPRDGSLCLSAQSILDSANLYRVVTVYG